MRKRTLQKAAVVLVFFSFLGLSATGLMAGTTTTDRSAKLSFSLLFKNPAQFLAVLFPGLRGLFGLNNPQPPSTSAVKVIKPTGTIKSIRLSGGD